MSNSYFSLPAKLAYFAILVLFVVVFVPPATLPAWFGYGVFWGEKSIHQEYQAKLAQILSDKSHYRTVLQKHRFFYERLTEKQQEQLREVYKEIVQAPQSEVLNQTLKNYCSWLKTLDPDEKEKIDYAKTIPEKLVVISEIKKQQEKNISANTSKPSNVKSKEKGSVSDNISPKDLAVFLESVTPKERLDYLGMLPDEFLFKLENRFREMNK